MAAVLSRAPVATLGRCFVHPLFDYLLIGGGLSLCVIPAVFATTGGAAMADFAMLPWFLLLSNSAHFAASTVRLYTKPSAAAQLPFLSQVLPALVLALLTFCMFTADSVGRYVVATYLIWSPYHYAAQAYGLAIMYCYRSGCRPALRHKWWLWAVATLPFYKVLLLSFSKHIIPWFTPAGLEWSQSHWRTGLAAAGETVGMLAIVLPFWIFAKVRRDTGVPVPLISLLVILANAVWFVLFPLLDGFIWTTIFHGIQYLAIVVIFHVRDQAALPSNHRSRAYHACWFYAVSLLLGYALFNCLPYGFQLLGFGAAESVLLVIAAINIHHFIVDAYIWKLRGGDPNRRIVESDMLSAPLTRSDAVAV